MRINWGSLTQIKRARWLETWTRCNWWRKNRTWPKPRAKLKNQTKVQNPHNHFREDQLWRKLISAAGIWDLCLWSWPIPYFFSSFLLLKKGNIIFFWHQLDVRSHFASFLWFLFYLSSTCYFKLCISCRFLLSFILKNVFVVLVWWAKTYYFRHFLLVKPLHQGKKMI